MSVNSTSTTASRMESVRSSANSGHTPTSTNANFKRLSTTATTVTDIASGNVQSMAPPRQLVMQSHKRNWLLKYGRQPLQSHVYYCPEELDYDTTATLLSTCPMLPGTIAMHVAVAYEADPDHPVHQVGPFTATGINGPYCERLLLYRADGLTVALNLHREGEVPSPLQTLLFSPNTRLIMFETDSQLTALCNTDSRLLGLNAKIHVRTLLNTVGHQLPSTFDPHAIAAHYFGSDIPLTFPDMAKEHLLLNDVLTVALLFDLATLFDALVVPATRNVRRVTVSVQTETTHVMLPTSNHTATVRPPSGMGNVQPFVVQYQSVAEIDKDITNFFRLVKDDFDDYFYDCAANVWTTEYNDFAAHWFNRLLQRYTVEPNLHRFFNNRLRKFLEKEFQKKTGDGRS